MGKNRGNKIVNLPGESLKRGSPIYDVQKDIPGEKEIRPAISITYMDVKKEYGIKHFVERAKKLNGDRDILKEFDNFLKRVRCYKSLQEVIDNFGPKEKIKNSDPDSIKKMREIQKEYNIDTSDMLHIHCCGGGSGQMVLHGFVLQNCFEVVWIDPEHKVHKLK